MIEKPFGHDLASAQELNRIVSSVFPSSSVFRIDHYLGKETVQNLMALRFANQLFEPVWNNNYVDHVQITMAEDIGIGGRAGYFDGIGIARDVIQNHLLQLLALTAMEEPTSFEAGQLRAEKQKVLAAARPPKRLDLHTARGAVRRRLGRRGEGRAATWRRTGSRRTPRPRRTRRSGWTSTTGAGPASRSTCAPASGWPAGSPRSRSGFKRAPHLPFTKTDTEELGYNALVLRIQPDEGVTLRFGAKVPGTQMEIREVNMDFAYGGSFTESSPEAYERLILDVLLGDPPLFPQHEEVELSWEILDPILDYWAEPAGAARAVRAGLLGSGRSRRDAGPRRLRLAAAMMNQRERASSSRAASSDDHHARRHQLGQDLRRAAAGPADRRQPGAGHGADLDRGLRRVGVRLDALEASMAAGREHPSRILLVVTGSGPARPSLDAEVRIGEGTPGEVVVIRMRGAVADHPASVIRPLLLPDSPVVIWWPGKAPQRPGGRRARPARPAPADRRRRRDASAGRAEGPGRGLLPRRHRSELDPADPVARPAGRRPGPVPGRGHRRRWSRPSGATRRPSCSPPGCATG